VLHPSNPLFALGMVNAESVRKGEMSRDHRIVHRNRDSELARFVLRRACPPSARPSLAASLGETRSAPSGSACATRDPRMIVWP